MPSLVTAHGVTSRADLPVPDVIIAWAAAAVLVVSFAGLAALWPKPRLEEPGWRPLGAFGRIAASRGVEIACGAIGLFLLGVVIWAGYAGRQSPQDNFAPVFVYVIFWVGLVFASLLFGDVFRAFNPWRAVGRLLRLRGVRPYPERLGRWPAALALLFFTWTELVGFWGDTPERIATYAVVYSVLTWIAMAVYGAETWASRGEGFGVYFNLFARMSAFETRDRVLGVRPLLGGLPKLDPVPGTVAVVCVLIGTVTFDGFSQGVLWRDTLQGGLHDLWTGVGFGIETATKVTDTTGLLLGPLLVAGFYALGIEGARSVGGGFDAARLRRAFVHTLVPIAIVYAMAHYLTQLVFQGQAIAYLASDPVGRGWDLFGTATSAIDYSVLGQDLTYYLQIGFVVFGHVCGLVLAHDRALALYAKAQDAVRSQYWMLAIMVGFTSLALWLLASINA